MSWARLENLGSGRGQDLARAGCALTVVFHLDPFYGQAFSVLDGNDKTLSYLFCLIINLNQCLVLKRMVKLITRFVQKSQRKDNHYSHLSILCNPISQVNSF